MHEVPHVIEHVLPHPDEHEVHVFIHPEHEFVHSWVQTLLQDVQDSVHPVHLILQELMHLEVQSIHSDIIHTLL